MINERRTCSILGKGLTKAHTYLGVGFLTFPCSSSLAKVSVSSDVSAGQGLQASPHTLLPSGIFVCQGNPYHGEQFAAASFSIGGKEYKDVIPYFTDG